MDDAGAETGLQDVPEGHPLQTPAPPVRGALRLALLLRRLKRMVFDAVGHLNDDDGWAMASHVALSALMALFPFLIFVATLGAFFGDPLLADRMATRLFEAWPDAIAAPVARELHAVLTVPRGDLLTLSFLVAAFLASNGVEAVRVALNRAYRAQERRGFFHRRLQSLVFVAVSGIVAVLLGVVGVLGPALFDAVAAKVPALAGFRADFLLARAALVSIVLLVALILSHVYLPAARPPVRKLWPGILVTVALALGATSGFAAYLDGFADYAATYAGLAGAVTAIFFFYLIALAVIFGAEVNAATDRVFGKGRARG